MSQSPQHRLASKEGQRVKGQIVVEYILLLIIGVAIALLITGTMVSRNPESPGFLIVRWEQIIRFIGADYADEPVSR